MLKPSIFVSYKRDHGPTTEAMKPIEAALLQQGFELWRDVNIESGAIWSNQLYSWLMECSGAIAMIGKEAAQSEWCRREWWFLRERNRTTGLPVIPVSVDGSHESAGILDDFQALKVTSLEDVIQQLRGLEAAKPSAKNYMAAHHAWLRWQFNDAPLWSREPFSLRDVYVETDCGKLTWGDIKGAEKPPRDPFKDDEENGGRHNVVQVVMNGLSEMISGVPRPHRGAGPARLRQVRLHAAARQRTARARHAAHPRSVSGFSAYTVRPGRRVDRGCTADWSN